MGSRIQPRRLRGLPSATVCDERVPVATGLGARLLGLSHLDREPAGPGLLIRRCSSVHTFGMRFPLDIVFLDRDGVPISVRQCVSPRRLVFDRRASSVLELPSPSLAPSPPAENRALRHEAGDQGGESLRLGP